MADTTPHQAEAFRQGPVDALRWGWQCLTCGAETYVDTLQAANDGAREHMSPATERCPSGAQCFPFGCAGPLGCNCLCHALPGEDTAEYSLNYVWERSAVIVHVNRELPPQSALDLADGLRYFAERSADFVTPSRTDRQPRDSVAGANSGQGAVTPS